MKTFRYALLLCMGLVATSAAAQDAARDGKLKVEFDNHTLSDVLDDLRDRSGYSLAYSPPLLVHPDGTPLRITIRMEAEPIRVLTAIIKAADCELDDLGFGNYVIRPAAARSSPAAPRKRTATTAVARPPVEPLVQKGTEQPLDQAFGTVYYPVPYASPPHLTLTPADRYVVVEQDAGCFTWLLRSKANWDEKTRRLANAVGVATVGVAENGSQPEFHWEASGLPSNLSTAGLIPLEQRGEFQTHQGGEGQVNFAVAYDFPPNVELELAAGSGGITADRYVVITECTETGFRWKHFETKLSNVSSFARPKWIAKGMRKGARSE